jgi:hypothetical protein
VSVSIPTFFPISGIGTMSRIPNTNPSKVCDDGELESHQHIFAMDPRRA